MLHPDLLSDLTPLQHQDKLRDVEIWRLQRQARRNRAIFLQRLLHRLVMAVLRWPSTIQHKVRKMNSLVPEKRGIFIRLKEVIK